MTYYDELKFEQERKLDKMLRELPPFCTLFFLEQDEIASSTKLAYAYDMLSFFKFICDGTIRDLTLTNLEEVELLDLEKFLATSASNAAYSRRLATLKRLFGHFQARRDIKNNPTPALLFPKKRMKEIVRLERKEVGDMQKSASNYSIRDRVIITMFLATGLRVSELAGLNVGEVNMMNKTFTVTRKGGKRDRIFMNDALHSQMVDYLNWLRPASPNEPLFQSKSKGSNRLGLRSIQLLVKDCSIQAGITDKVITPHRLRATFATHMRAQTKDIHMVAKLLDHSDITTTAKYYAGINDDEKREAINALTY